MVLSILKPKVLDMMNVRELMKDLVRISAPEISYDMEEVLMDCFVKKYFTIMTIMVQISRRIL